MPLTPSMRLVVAASATALAAATLPGAPASASTTLDPLPLPEVSALAAPAPGQVPITFYAGMRRDEAGARRALDAISDPSSGRYRDFGSHAGVRKRFGADPDDVIRLAGNAARFGLTVRLDPTGLFVRIRGRAEQMSRWLKAPVSVVSAQVGTQFARQYSSNGKPPRAVRSLVREWVPIDLVATNAPPRSAEAQKARKEKNRYRGINRGTPRSCLPRVSPRLSRFAYSFNQLRTAYGIDSVPRTARIGRATRLMIMNLGQTFSPQAQRMSARCQGVPVAATATMRVDGLRDPLPVGTEGDLDMQAAQSVLPRGATVGTVDQAGFDRRWFLPWAMAYRARADVLSSSYGLCERKALSLGAPTLALTESAFARLGLTGTSILIASGDRGSSSCVNNSTGKGPKGRNADYPSVSPLVTGVGGTRLVVDRRNQRVREVVWNSSGALPPTGPAPVAGGGGTSRFFARPWWQSQEQTGSRTRAVPDLAANAVPGPGWPIVTDTGSGPQFTVVGGTSAAAPFTAATLAVLAGRERVAGRPPFGLANPTLYSLAASRPRSFYDVRRGSNDLFDVGCCDARRGYDEASGLGAPDFGVWSRFWPAPAVSGRG